MHWQRRKHITLGHLPPSRLNNEWHLLGHIVLRDADYSANLAELGVGGCIQISGHLAWGVRLYTPLGTRRTANYMVIRVIGSRQRRYVETIRNNNNKHTHTLTQDEINNPHSVGNLAFGCLRLGLEIGFLICFLGSVRVSSFARVLNRVEGGTGYFWCYMCSLLLG